MKKLSEITKLTGAINKLTAAVEELEETMDYAAAIMAGSVDQRGWTEDERKAYVIAQLKDLERRALEYITKYSKTTGKPS